MARTEPPEITVAHEGSGAPVGFRTVIRLRGEHDVSNVDALADMLARVLVYDQADVVIDLSELQFMAGATVGALSRAHGLLKAQSRSLTIRSASGLARRILVLLGMGDQLVPMPTESTHPIGAGALATWVEVPAANAGRRPDAPVIGPDTSATSERQVSERESSAAS